MSFIMCNFQPIGQLNWPRATKQNIQLCENNQCGLYTLAVFSRVLFLNCWIDITRSDINCASKVYRLCEKITQRKKPKIRKWAWVYSHWYVSYEFMGGQNRGKTRVLVKCNLCRITPTLGLYYRQLSMFIVLNYAGALEC